MSKNAIIKVEGLSKHYLLNKNAMQKSDTLYGNFINGLKNIKNITQKKETEDFWALKDISFEIEKGDRVGIIGRNGAGKSTLLKILSRITPPTKGRIEYTGRMASLLEVGTGFHGDLSGRENIYLNGSILGMSKFEIDRKFDEIVDFAEVEKFIDTPVKRYSSGMYVRLAFAVAAHLEPEILIVDEVLAVGDAEFQKKCLGKMEDVSNNEGRTILFVSHQMAAIKQLCNKGIILTNGSVTFSGNINSAIDEYQNINNKYIGFRYSKRSRDNKNLELLAAEISDFNEDAKSEYSIGEDIFIKLQINCNIKIPNLYGYITVKNAQGDVYIESDTYDVMPNVLENVEIGINEYKLKINKNVLPVGNYNVYVNFTSSFADKFDVESPGDILNFQVIDLETRRGENRKSYTSQILKWERV
jgi:lipopolysaccharide transport system ATP-binding protein